MSVIKVALATVISADPVNELCASDSEYEGDSDGEANDTQLVHENGAYCRCSSPALIFSYCAIGPSPFIMTVACHALPRSIMLPVARVEPILGTELS